MSDDSLEDLLAVNVAAIETSDNKAETIREAEIILLKRNKKVRTLKG